MPDTPTLTFGLSRLHSAGSGQVGALGQGLAAALQELLGRPVQPVLTDSYGDLVEALCSGRVDVAWLAPLLQSAAQARGARLLALTQRGGSVAFRSAILVERGSRFQRAQELLGARAAWRNPQSASGYVFPRLELLQLGATPRPPFAQETFYGSMVAGAEAVVRGEADFVAIAITKAAGSDELLREAELFRLLGPPSAALRTVHVTALIPPDAFCVGAHVTPALEADLGRALFALHGTPRGADALRLLVQAERLVPVQATMLLSLRSWAAMLQERAAEMQAG